MIKLKTRSLKTYNINKFIFILFLCLSYTTLLKAENIRDFQIEGISLGDSALDHSIIKNYQKGSPYTNKKYQDGIKKIKSDSYDVLQFFFIKKDEKKTLENISGKKFFPNNINECLKKKKIIENEITKLFPNLKQQSMERPHPGDPSKKSIIYALNYFFPEGDLVQVSCTDWVKFKDRNGRLKNSKDELKVQLSLSSYIKFVRYDAWK